MINNTKTIYLRGNITTFYKAVSADAGSQDGANPHAVIFNELHRQKNRDLWDVLTYGSDTREQPLTIAVTTAGIESSHEASSSSPCSKDDPAHGVSSDDGSPSLDGRMKRRISEAEPEAGGDMKAPGIDLDSTTVRGPQVDRRPAESGQPANSDVFGKVKCHVGADIESDRRL